MKHKRFARLIVCVLLLCLVLSGCASSEGQPANETAEGELISPMVWLPEESNSELERLNFDLDYTTAYYSYPNSLYDDFYAVEAFHNLTNTQVDNNQQEGLAVGWKILSGTEELAAFEQTIQEVEAAYSEQLRQERPNADDSKFELVSMTRKTASVEYTEEFFQENSLLLIDLCAWCSPRARFYPENLKIDGDTASIDIRWDCINALTGGSSGQYCLIIIPKGCTAAALNIIRDTGDG